MLALQKAEGLPPHFAIAGGFEMEGFAPSEPEERTLSLVAGETTGAHTTTGSFQAERSWKGAKRKESSASPTTGAASKRHNISNGKVSKQNFTVIFHNTDTVFLFEV